MRSIAGESHTGKLMNDIYVFVLNNNQPGSFGPQMAPQFNAQFNVPMQQSQPLPLQPPPSQQQQLSQQPPQTQQTNFSSRGPIFPSSIQIPPQSETFHPSRSPSFPPSPSPLVQSDNYNPPRNFLFPNQTTPPQQILPQPNSSQPIPQSNSQPPSSHVSQRPSTPTTFNQPPPSLPSQKQQAASPNVAFGSQRQSTDQQQNLDSPQSPRKPSLFSNSRSQSTTITQSTPSPARPNEQPTSAVATTVPSSQDQRALNASNSTTTSNTKNASGNISALSSRLWLYAASLQLFEEAVKENKIELAVESFGKILKTFIGVLLFYIHIHFIRYILQFS